MPINVCSWAAKYTPVFFIFIKHTNQTVNWIEGRRQEKRGDKSVRSSGELRKGEGRMGRGGAEQTCFPLKDEGQDG